MKRTNQIRYESNEGRALITLRGTDKAYVEVANCTADELEELATACSAAAEELRTNAEREAAGI